MTANVAAGHGCCITAIETDAGVPILWGRKRPLRRHASSEVGPGGEGSYASFDELFVGGWFELFPTACLPGVLDGRQTRLHGEACRVPWRLESRSEDEMVASASCSGFRMERRIRVEGNAVECLSRHRNDTDHALRFTHGEHPCFPRSQFAGGRLRLRAKRAWTEAPAWDPDCSRLRPGSELEWPLAAATDGESIDLEAIPKIADGRQDHVCMELERGSVVFDAPLHGFSVELDFSIEEFPYLLLWQKFDRDQGGADPFDVFALEPLTFPGRGIDDAVARGSVRELEPGEIHESRVSLSVLASTLG